MWSTLSFPTQTRLKFDLCHTMHIDSTIPLHGSTAVTKVKHVNVMELCDMVRMILGAVLIIPVEVMETISVGR